MSDQLVLERSDSVLIMRLNRPEARNALTGALVRQISSTLLDAEADQATRVLVITGTGDRAFCGGMDLADFADSGDDEFSDLDAMEGFRRLLDGDLALARDRRRERKRRRRRASNSYSAATSSSLRQRLDSGSPSQTRCSLPWAEHLLGHAPPTRHRDGTRPHRWTHIARSVLSRALGLVNKLVAPELVVETALEYAHRIAANGPLAVSATKELIRLGITDPERAHSRIAELRETIFTSHDAQEGAAAFIERRAPVWTGR